MNKTYTNRSFFISLLVVFMIPLLSQEEPKPPATKPDSSTTKVTLDSLTKASKLFKGMFAFYQDTLNGSLQMFIEKSQLNKEYIHFAHSLNGVVDVGHFKGAYRGSKIFSIRKYFNKILFEAENSRVR